MDIETKEIKHPRTKLRIENRDFLFSCIKPEHDVLSCKKFTFCCGGQKIATNVNHVDNRMMHDLLFSVMKRDGTYKNFFNDVEKRQVALNLDHHIKNLPDSINTLEKVFNKIVEFVGKYMTDYLEINSKFIPKFPSGYSNVYIIPQKKWEYSSYGFVSHGSLNIYVCFPENSYKMTVNENKELMYDFIHAILHEFLEYMSYKQFLLAGNINDNGKEFSVNLFQRRQDFVSYGFNFSKQEGMMLNLETTEVFRGFHEGVLEVMIDDMFDNYNEYNILKNQGDKNGYTEEGIYVIFKKIIYAIFSKVKECHGEDGLSEFKKELFRGFFTGNMSVFKLIEKIYGRHALRILSVADPRLHEYVNKSILAYLQDSKSLEEVKSILPRDVVVRILLQDSKKKIRKIKEEKKKRNK